MTHSPLSGHADTSVSSRVSARVSSRGARRRVKDKKQVWISVGLQLIAMLGIAGVLYPQAANWVTTLGHSAEVSGYVRQSEGMPEPERWEKFEQARLYNTNIPQGVLRDPYSQHPGEDDFTSDPRYRPYLEQLTVGEGDTIGEVSYPGLGISLPIYHGTTDEVLSKGVGHLYGSSLPVGGPSTHAVMTSHSGLANASLFTKLPEAAIGDVFTVTVLGEKQYYEVRNLETVLPHEAESLQVSEGEDWVTLLTCTPLNINSHRFLVQAHRIPNPEGEGIISVAGNELNAGFPWWALVFLAGSALSAYLIFGPTRKKKHVGKHHSAHSPETAGPGLRGMEKKS